MIDVGDFECSGFAIIPGVLDPAEVDALSGALERLAPGSALERGGQVYASRNVLRDVPEIRQLAAGDRLRPFVEAALGPGAFVVRGLWFDKTPGANWMVPWHQDLTIAVKARRDAPGYGPWTVKGGLPHVRPPTEVLNRMVSVRVHLDPSGVENGPLRVVPGSHLGGMLGAGKTRDWLERGTSVTCPVPRGGVLLMRPLLLHASSASNSPGHRRVIHLEYAADSLPHGVEWFEDP